MKVEFEGERCVVTIDDKIVMKGKKDETGLFAVVEKNEEFEEVNYTNVSKIQQWHEKLGHLSLNQIKKLHQMNNLEGLKDEDFKEKIDCDVCKRGKKIRKKFDKKNEKRTKERGEIIHSDVCGPITPKTHGGNKYYVSFIDDYTRMSWVFMMKKKSEVVEKFKQLHKMLLTQYNVKIKSLMSDGGGEYVNDEMERYMIKHGMIHRKTPPYTPQRNGVAERFNRTIVEKIR